MLLLLAWDLPALAPGLCQELPTDHLPTSSPESLDAGHHPHGVSCIPFLLLMRACSQKQPTCAIEQAAVQVRTTTTHLHPPCVGMRCMNPGQGGAHSSTLPT